MYFLIYATNLLCCENEGLWLYSLHLATVTGNDDLLHWFGLQKKKNEEKNRKGKVVGVSGSLVCLGSGS